MHRTRMCRSRSRCSSVVPADITAHNCIWDLASLATNFLLGIGLQECRARRLLHLQGCTNLCWSETDLGVFIRAIPTTEDREEVTHEDLTKDHCRSILLIHI